MGFLPVGLRPAWSGASFLLYAGAFTVLGALGVLLGSLAEMHGSTALIGWSALFLALLLAVAVASDRDDRRVVAGLSAFVAVAVAGVAAGALLDAIGLADSSEPFDRDLELAPFVVEVVVLAAALVAARRFRFPLLLLAATIATTVLVLDTTAAVFGTGNWVATAALLLGFGELAIARSLDASGRPEWAFWKHVAAAFTIGGAVLWLLDGNDVGWVVIGLISLGYVALARAFGRSVWAIVGALGLLLTTSHFVDESDAIVRAIPFLPTEGVEGAGLELWQTALVYIGLGVAYALLAQFLRQPTTHDVPPA